MFDASTANIRNKLKKLWNYNAERFVNTGLTFCGLIMRDNSKCGINTTFNTGTVVGVSTNIFVSGFPRNFVPSYSWGGANGFTTYKLNDALEKASEAFDRRRIKFDDKEKKCSQKSLN